MESDIFSRSRASWQHFVMRFAWLLAITEWSVIYTQSWFTTPKLRWILSMATLSSFNFPSSIIPPSFFLSLTSLSLYPSLCFCYILDKDRERLHVSSCNATVSTFNYTCMDTVPHKSPLYPWEKKITNIFEIPSRFYLVIGRVSRILLRCFECNSLKMKSVEIAFKLKSLTHFFSLFHFLT